MTSRILITAFEPFGGWKSNASELALNYLQRKVDLPSGIEYRVYPVDFERVPILLQSDLNLGFDLTIHLGQTQQTSRLRLEAIGINRGMTPDSAEMSAFPLIPGGREAYQCQLPVAEWAGELRRLGIPSYVSYHAGTYLCNAMVYWTHHLITLNGFSTQSLFVHVPLDVSQVVGLSGDYYTLPSELTAQGIAELIRFWGRWKYPDESQVQTLERTT